VFGILSRIQSKWLPNIGSISGRRKTLLPSPRRLKLFCYPQVLGFSRRFSGRIVKVTTYFDLMPRLRMRGNITTLRIRLRHVFRWSLRSKQTTNNQTKSELLAAVFIMIHVFCHVMPFRLAHSHRLQITEVECARFLRNVGVCLITRYTAPHPRRTESSRTCINYTHK